MFRKTADLLRDVITSNLLRSVLQIPKLCDSDLASLWRYYFCTHSVVCKEARMAQSVQGPATGWTARNSYHDRDKRFSHLQNRPDTLGPHSLLLNGHWNSFPEVMRPGRAVHHSPPCNAEVKNEWSSNSSSPYALMALSGTNFSLPVAWIDKSPGLETFGICFVLFLGSFI
jgi:hypothetical protein